MMRAWSLVLLLLLLGCDQQLSKDGVDNVLGLKFGVPLDLKVKKDQTEIPEGYAYLKEFHKVDFPNNKFEFVGVAITRNSEKNRKAGLVFREERLIWGALFHNKKRCEEKDFMRTKEYLEKNWKITPIKESRSGSKKFPELKSTFASPGAVWTISCAGFNGLDLAVTDYSVLKKAGDDKTKENVDKILSKISQATQKKT